MDNNNTSKLIGGFVVLIIGLVLLTQISVGTNTNTKLIAVQDRLTIEKVPPGNLTGPNNITYVYQLSLLDDAWRQDITECSKATLATGTNIIIYNSTGAEMMNNGACSGDTNEYYIIEGASTLKICNANFVNGTANTYVDVRYQTCPTGYMGANWGRTALDLIPGLFAIALMLVGVGLFYSVYQDWSK